LRASHWAATPASAGWRPGPLRQRSLGTPYNTNIPAHARIALTSFNPFSPGFDYNAVLTAAQTTALATTSGAAVTSLRTTHNIVVRNTGVPHSLRGTPTQNADPTTQSTPLHISTHLFHNMADVDNLIAKLMLTVPMPGAGSSGSK